MRGWVVRRVSPMLDPPLRGYLQVGLLRPTVSIVGSLRDREVACSASDRQGLNFESCVWRTVSSQSSHHPQEVLLAQFSLYVHKGGIKPDSFHLLRPTGGRFYKNGHNISILGAQNRQFNNRNTNYSILLMFLLFERLDRPTWQTPKSPS